MTKAFDAKTMTRLEIESFLREKELAGFKQVLAQTGPRLIVVSGDEGLGKSSLLRVFHIAAMEMGRRVAPTDLRGALRVNAETSENSFTGEVAALLGILPEDLASAPEGQRIELPAEPTLRSFPQIVISRGRLGDLASADSNSRSGPQQGGSPVELRRRFHPLIERIRSRSEKTEAPILLLIDEYDPSKEFDSWFGGHFLAELRKSVAMMTLVVAGEPKKVKRLVARADLHLLLEAPDEGFIRQTLARMADRIMPPMAPAEMGLYVKEIVAQPHLLRHLLRALMLGETERK